MTRLASITDLFSFLSFVMCLQAEGQAVGTQEQCERDQDCRRTHGPDWFCRGVEGRCELWLDKRCLPFATRGCTDSRDLDADPALSFVPALVSEMRELLIVQLSRGRSMRWMERQPRSCSRVF